LCSGDSLRGRSGDSESRCRSQDAFIHGRSKLGEAPTNFGFRQVMPSDHGINGGSEEDDLKMFVVHGIRSMSLL
jgi:hypothetical protein